MNYPENFQSSHENVYARIDGDYYLVYFPYSKAAVEKAKSVLKAPRFDRATQAWMTKKRWNKQLPEQMEAIAEVVRDEEAKKQAAAEAERQAKQEADRVGREAFEAMPPYKGGIRARLSDNGQWILMDTAYHGKIVDLFRSLGGSFDRKLHQWILPIAAGKDIAAYRDQIKEWHNETVNEKQARRAEREAQKEARKAARYLERAEDCPQPGSVIKYRDEWQKVDGLGKVFRADEDTSSLGGPIGAEGDPVRYVYLTEPTEDEIAEAEKREAMARKIEKQNAEIREAVAKVAAGEPAPNTGQVPEGEVIWKNQRSAPQGLEYWIVWSDGWLYHLTYDGTDGGTWGRFNAGYNTRATRVPATDDLVQALRQ